MVDKIDVTSETFKNPFREHIKNTRSRKDFTPPEEVYFGFKPVKDTSDLLPVEPELNGDDLDILPGPPYFIKDQENEFKDLVKMFPIRSFQEVSIDS